MRTLGFAFLITAAAALGGCGSVGNLSLDDLHLGGATPAKPKPAELLSADTEDALYLGAIEGLEKQQRYGAALAFLDRYAVKEGNELPARYWLLRGNALAGSNKYAEAAATFDRLDNTPLAAQGWNGKGSASAAAGQWAEASFGFQNAVTGDPSNSEYLNNLGFAQMHLGRAPEAEGNLRQAYELAPQSDLIRNNLAIALTMRGDKAGADEVLRAIKSAPDRERITALAQKFSQTSLSSMEKKS